MSEAPLPLVDAYARRIEELHIVLRQIAAPIPSMDNWDAPRLLHEIRAMESMARDALPSEFPPAPSDSGVKSG